MDARLHADAMRTAALDNPLFSMHSDGSESVFSSLAVSMSEIEDPRRRAEAFLRLAMYLECVGYGSIDFQDVLDDLSRDLVEAGMGSLSWSAGETVQELHEVRSQE